MTMDRPKRHDEPERSAGEDEGANASCRIGVGPGPFGVMLTAPQAETLTADEVREVVERERAI